MNLHENQQLFQDAVIATAERLGIPEIYVEKDYWVTVALHAIFHSVIAGEAVFKGGTALSKCHRLIDRFSEDVDIVVLAQRNESRNQLKSKLKAITEAVARIIPEEEIVGITNKRGMIRKTAHKYPRQDFTGIFGQVREHIVIEASWLGSAEPHGLATVCSYITEMMMAQGRDELIGQYSILPFTVNVLSKERTLCEKIMSLVRFSQTENPYTDLANKIRHVYDLHQMLKDERVISFFDSPNFDEMLIKVGMNDRKSFKNNNLWLANHPAKAIIFSHTEDTWSKIKTAYRTTFRELVLGKLPTEFELINTMKKIYSRLQHIEWKIPE